MKETIAQAPHVAHFTEAVFLADEGDRVKRHMLLTLQKLTFVDDEDDRVEELFRGLNVAHLTKADFLIDDETTE